MYKKNESSCSLDSNFIVSEKSELSEQKIAGGSLDYRDKFQ